VTDQTTLSHADKARKAALLSSLRAALETAQALLDEVSNLEENGCFPANQNQFSPLADSLEAALDAADTLCRKNS
jgi:hypothetical protein